MVKIAAFLLLTIVPFTAVSDETRTDALIAGRDAGFRKNIVLPPLITEKYEYYEVCGCTEKDLQCDMSEKAIRWRDGNKYDSITSWKVDWNYSCNRDSGSRFADSFRLSVDIAIHVPQWTPTADAPRPLVDKWHSYIRKLILHEHGHRDLVVEAASELTRAVAELSQVQTCRELERAVSALCRMKMSRLDEIQNAYDATTNHGFAQGVAFP